ncbi:hypothetical protein T484DRAFT_1895615 [Baffinella frigidus]|nr:hypothetical protein T484DRAFT_1895615 [Cryptophyta sp. CCMP2293]
MEPHAEVLSALAVLARELGVSSLLSMDALRDALNGPCSHCGALCSQEESGTTQPQQHHDVAVESGEHRVTEIPQAPELMHISRTPSVVSVHFWDKLILQSDNGFQGEAEAISSCPAAFTAFLETCSAFFAELRRKSMVAATHRDIWIPGVVVLLFLLLITLESLLVRADKEEESRIAAETG